MKRWKNFAPNSNHRAISRLIITSTENIMSIQNPKTDMSFAHSILYPRFPTLVFLHSLSKRASAENQIQLGKERCCVVGFIVAPRDAPWISIIPGKNEVSLCTPPRGKTARCAGATNRRSKGEYMNHGRERKDSSERQTLATHFAWLSRFSVGLFDEFKRVIAVCENISTLEIIFTIPNKLIRKR